VKLESVQWDALGMRVGSSGSESEVVISLAGQSGVVGRDGERQEGMGEGAASNVEEAVRASSWRPSPGDRAPIAPCVSGFGTDCENGATGGGTEGDTPLRPKPSLVSGNMIICSVAELLELSRGANLSKSLTSSARARVDCYRR